MTIRLSDTVSSLLLVIACLSTPACAAEHDLQLWTPITLDAPIHRHVRGYIEVGPRMGNNITGLNQLLIRPALEFRIKERFSVFTGYLWQTTYNNNNVLHEHRLWEQILLNKQIKRLTIINRSRLEQRFFSNLSQTGNRARHLVKLNYSLGDRVYLSTSNEIFVNLNSVTNGPERGIDQDRYFVGLGLKLLKQARIEAGYQLQYVNRSDPFDDLANHAILIQTFVGLWD
jgi:hypothetical protein